MNKLYYVIFVMCFSLFSFNSNAALSLDATRYIFVEGESSTNIVITNKSDEEYAAQLWIESDGDEDNTKFIVVPSFFRIDPQKSQTARIIKVSDNVSREQESLHWVNVQEIPPKRNGSGISMAIRTMVKLLFRPKHLEEYRDAAEMDIAVSTQGSSTRMVNSTPYVFAVGNLYNEDDVKIDVPKDTVTELSTFLPGESVTVPSSSIGWVNAINDYGRIKKFKIGVN